VFGVAAMPVGFITALLTVATTMSLVEELSSMGYFWLGPGGPELDAALLYGALPGPWVLSGLVAAGRMRWWCGLLLGAAVGGLITTGLWLTHFGVGSIGLLIGIQRGWMAGGLAGGLMSSLRRRFRC
jgi:hypothetical protein